MHIPVLFKAVLEGLDIKPNDTVLDATINGAGHSKLIAERLGAGGRLIGLDADSRAVARATEALAGAACKVTVLHQNFRTLDKALESLGIAAVDKVLFDFGLSSNQLDDPARGFSFMADGPLAMTLDDAPGAEELTAETFVNGSSESALADIIYAYGEERYARRIAKAIVEARSIGPITSTGELAAIVTEAVPASYRSGRIHPATRTFQALRMAVNDELGAIKQGLSRAFMKLSNGGRLAAISFHSLEDRLVKEFIRGAEKEGTGTALYKKPLTADEAEIRENPRSRSAKLRIIIKK